MQVAVQDRALQLITAEVSGKAQETILLVVGVQQGLLVFLGHRVRGDFGHNGKGQGVKGVPVKIDLVIIKPTGEPIALVEPAR